MVLFLFIACVAYCGISIFVGFISLYRLHKAGDLDPYAPFTHLVFALLKGILWPILIVTTERGVSS